MDDTNLSFIVILSVTTSSFNKVKQSIENMKYPFLSYIKHIDRKFKKLTLSSFD